MIKQIIKRLEGLDTKDLSECCSITYSSIIGILKQTQEKVTCENCGVEQRKECDHIHLHGYCSEWEEKE